ncbi:ribonuclease H-like domain-containing protein [Tanacetum coccineum]
MMQTIVIKWLNSTLPNLNLPVIASDEEFRTLSADGTILCRLMNKLGPGPAIEGYGNPHQSLEAPSENVDKFLAAMGEMSLPNFNISDLERSVLGATPCVLPSAFSTMANRDPTWNMDTSASSHLNLHRINDFLTCYILLRCDSSGDLYPVTSPSPTPHPLLSVSHSTWHQRLGHPGEDVLCSRMPRQFISCNKEKSSHLCHAYKARLVANGHSQQFVVDCDDTFSHVVKPATIRMVLSLALLCVQVGFSSSRCDSSLFIYQHGFEVVYLLIYVDDIVLTTSSTDLLQRIIPSLHKEFNMTDLGALNYFLGISVTRDSTSMFLSQKKYASELLDRAYMANYNLTRTPVDTKSKLGSDGDPISHPTLYPSLAGGLQYLTFTRPYISYTVQQVCLHMHDSREPHLAALKRVL